MAGRGRASPGGLVGRRLHFVGIGGAGMSGLALVARARRRRNRLRPRRDAPTCGAARGGDRAGDRPRPARCARHVEVVVSTAIRPTCPRSRRPRARARHRSELLEQVAQLRRVIAVAGTHGKTTTTAMVAHVLTGCGLDPGWAVGAELRGPDGRAPNALWGAGSGWSSRPTSPTARSCASIRRSPSSRTSSSTTTRPTAPEPEVEEAFGAFLARSRPTGPRSSGSTPASRPPDGARTVGSASAPGLGFAPDLERRATARASSWPATARSWRRRAAGARPAQRPERARRARAPPRRPAARSTPRAALASFRPAGRRFEARGEAAGVRVIRRLRPPPDRGRGDARAARELGARPAGRRLPAAPVLAHAAHPPRARARARAAPTWSWCSTSIPPGSGRGRARRRDAGSSWRRRRGRQRGGRPVWWLPTLAEASGVLGIAEPGDLVVTLGAGDVDRLCGATGGPRPDEARRDPPPRARARLSRSRGSPRSAPAGGGWFARPQSIAALERLLRWAHGAGVT